MTGTEESKKDYGIRQFLTLCCLSIDMLEEVQTHIYDVPAL
jgi:hypothetical protein